MFSDDTDDIKIIFQDIAQSRQGNKIWIWGNNVA